MHARTADDERVQYTHVQYTHVHTAIHARTVHARTVHDEWSTRRVSTRIVHTRTLQDERVQYTHTKCTTGEYSTRTYKQRTHSAHYVRDACTCAATQGRETTRATGGQGASDGWALVCSVDARPPDALLERVEDPCAGARAKPQ